MSAYVNGDLVPPVDAGTIDGIPANLTPAGAGQDGYVVTFSNANGDLELAPSSGGFANPMTAAGDTIVGGVAGAATALHVGSTGFVYRVVGGTPVWRGLCAEGTGAARPTAADQYVGQWYWSNDAAAGLELAVCIYEGGVTFAWVTVPYGVTATGISLVTADDPAAARTALGVSAYTVRSKTTTYTALAGDVLLCDASGGAFTVTLPAAATVSGSSISVKKTDASADAITVAGAPFGVGFETIDGAATLPLATQYTAVTLWSDGTSWWVF